MKKLILIFISCLTLSFIESNAQSTPINTKQADTTGLYVRLATSRYSTATVSKNAVPIDSMKKIMGKLSLSTAINHLWLETGTNKTLNTAVLISGTKTVTNTAITATSKVVVFLISPSGIIGVNYAVPTITAGTSFVINSYQTTGSVQTSDTSTVGYVIIN